MPRPHIVESQEPVTRSQLVADLRRLGLRPGMTVMVHTAMSALGWVVGGSQTIVEALLACVGDEGTICAQASWEDVPFGIASWPGRWQRAYETEMPPFDPRLSAAAPYEGRIPERIRTWPGARRSANPAAGVTAIGRRAAELTADHRLDDGFGAGTPYARLVAAGGVVLLLGSPLGSISLLHHAEAIADAPKRWTTYRLPVLVGQRRRWLSIREIDVWRGAFRYDDDDPLAAIARDALAGGIGAVSTVGAARCHLYPAPELTSFAVSRLEARFGATAARAGRR
jgi:aminoglycoside 3-N-acetyltransferase